VEKTVSLKILVKGTSTQKSLCSERKKTQGGKKRYPAEALTMPEKHRDPREKTKGRGEKSTNLEGT